MPLCLFIIIHREQHIADVLEFSLCHKQLDNNMALPHGRFGNCALSSFPSFISCLTSLCFSSLIHLSLVSSYPYLIAAESPRGRKQDCQQVYLHFNNVFKIEIDSSFIQYIPITVPFLLLHPVTHPPIFLRTTPPPCFYFLFRREQASNRQ